jgi:hypothetical protein
MKMFHRIVCAALLVLGLPLVATGAEDSTSIPGYTIHHTAFTSDVLAPEMAHNYQLTRSSHRGLLNVSLVKESPGTTGQAVSAQVKATGKRLTGQVFEIPMREIKDGDAVYYFGEFGVVEGETIQFAIEVTPPDGSKAHAAALTQQFFPR